MACSMDSEGDAPVIHRWLHSLKIARAGLAVVKKTNLRLLDFSKAFDKVNHSKLILKLLTYVIRNSTLLCTQAFLNNRKQRVVVESEEYSVPVTSGVPQGSVLGPSCFWSTSTTFLMYKTSSHRCVWLLMILPFT